MATKKKQAVKTAKAVSNKGVSKKAGSKKAAVKSAVSKKKNAGVSSKKAAKVLKAGSLVNPKKTVPKKISSVKSSKVSKVKAAAGKTVKTVKKATAKIASQVVSKVNAKAKPVAKKAAQNVTKLSRASVSAAKSSVAAKTGRSIVWEDFFTPLDDRVLVRQAEASDRTPSGLYIPDTVEERPNQGTVVSAGRGRKGPKGKIRPMDVKAGDVVLFVKYSGLKIEMQGEQMLILREDEILGVMEK